MTSWRWVTISPDLNLTLTLDSDDPELIARVEHSAEQNRITLQRIEPEEVGAPARPLGVA
jgi:hypothetical protein